MDSDIAINFYQTQKTLSQDAIDKWTKIFRLWALIRLSLFLLLVADVYFLWGKWSFLTLFGLIIIISFLWAISRFQDAKTTLNKSKVWKRLIEYEILSLQNEDISHFGNGNEFKDSKHAYSYDLDLFGEKSVFQFFNRTFSNQGKQKLAEWFQNGTENPERNNHLIESLSKEMDWCVQFRVNGALDERKEALNVNLFEMSRFNFQNPKWMKMASYFLTITGIGTCLAYGFSFISGYYFALAVIINLVVVGKYVGRTNAIIRTLTDYEIKIQFLIDQMELLQRLSPKEPELQKFVAKITSKGDGAIDSLKSLLKIQKRFEYRMNLLVGFVLNSLVVWDLHQRVQLEKWMKVHQIKIGQWEKELIELETYICGATIKFNYPKTTYAEFTEGDNIAIQSLKHPLITENKVVPNDVQFDETKQLMILTGPNMAGKSTYLRSVGLLFVLANAGFPIFAEKASIPHYHLYSSMRTSDDLSHESSYFHAELTRLRYILDKVESGEKVFILLDEILKGTNSIDKEQGSKQFLKKLEQFNVRGIIATHDLSLCELAKESHYFFNGYFDSVIQNNELFFDYLWRTGVCQNMNASFLLKRLKLID